MRSAFDTKNPNPLMTGRYPKPYIALSALIIIGLVILSFFNITVFGLLERFAFDIECRFTTSFVQAKLSKFALVSIDSQGIGPTGGQAFTNSELSELITILKQGKVKQIVLTFPLFMEHKGLLPLLDKTDKQLLDSLPQATRKTTSTWVTHFLQGLRRKLDSDSLLVTNIKQAGNVLLALWVSPIQDNRGESSTWIPGILLNPDPKSAQLFKAMGLQIAKPSFREAYDASAGAGHCLIFYGEELPQRMHLPFIYYNNGLVPSLPVLLAMRYLGSTPSQVEVAPDQIKIGNRVIPLVGGKVIVSPSLAFQTLPRFSANKILAEKKTPLELAGKTAILGFPEPIHQTGYLPVIPNGHKVSKPELIAGIAENLMFGPYVRHPHTIRYLEASFILVLGILTAFVFPRTRYISGLLLLILLILLSLSVGWAFLSFAGIWFRVSHSMVLSVALFVGFCSIHITRSEGLAREAVEANRLLGLNFQKQGVMDLAFERFKMCPLNNLTRDLIYELAQECESRGLNSLASQAYSYILKKGDFRDAAQRLIRLHSLDRFPGFDSQGARKREGPLTESFIRQKKMVGKYQVIRPLGKGTMGYVYKAVDPKINRPVALKIIRFSDEFDEDLIAEIRERFFREAEIAGRLNHPSIVTIYDVGEDHEMTYMAMEYLKGKDLEVYCKKDTLLPLMKVLDVIYHVAGALHYAHQMGVIHRDIKPANIMLLANGAIKVTDFGIAKAVSASRTKTGVILGTPNYMSPEQIMGHDMDARSDIFSLGVLFFQLLTGELPFHGDNLSSLLYQITQARHPSIRKIRPKIPRACEQIIDKALAKSPADRFKSAKDMKRYIQLLIMRLKEIKNKNRPKYG